MYGTQPLNRMRSTQFKKKNECMHAIERIIDPYKKSLGFDLLYTTVLCFLCFHYIGIDHRVGVLWIRTDTYLLFAIPANPAMHLSASIPKKNQPIKYMVRIHSFLFNESLRRNTITIRLYFVFNCGSQRYRDSWGRIRFDTGECYPNYAYRHSMFDFEDFMKHWLEQYENTFTLNSKKFKKYLTTGCRHIQFHSDFTCGRSDFI